MEGYGNYDLAVVRNLATSLPGEALRQNNLAAVELQKARQQHSQYTKVTNIDTIVGA